MKSFNVFVRPASFCSGADGARFDEIELYDHNDALYFEMDVEDGEEVAAWTDGDYAAGGDTSHSSYHSARHAQPSGAPEHVMHVIAT